MELFVPNWRSLSFVLCFSVDNSVLFDYFKGYANKVYIGYIKQQLNLYRYQHGNNETYLETCL
jgi:hypothetical protein